MSLKGMETEAETPRERQAHGQAGAAPDPDELLSLPGALDQRAHNGGLLRARGAGEREKREGKNPTQLFCGSPRK